MSCALLVDHPITELFTVIRFECFLQMQALSSSSSWSAPILKFSMRCREREKKSDRQCWWRAGRDGGRIISLVVSIGWHLRRVPCGRAGRRLPEPAATTTPADFLSRVSAVDPCVSLALANPSSPVSPCATGTSRAATSCSSSSLSIALYVLTIGSSPNFFYVTSNRASLLTTAENISCTTNSRTRCFNLLAVFVPNKWVILALASYGLNKA